MKAYGLWKYKFTVVDVSVQLEVWCMSLGVKASYPALLDVGCSG